MESLEFAINAVLPIILMVAIGYFLRRIGFINSDFAKMANKLVFRVFLPTMLCLNVFGIDASMNIGVTYILFAVGFILLVYFIAIPITSLVTKKSERRAPVLQAVFRSNYALIGIPLAEAFFGKEGAIVAALLSAFSIPLYNVMAVITFSAFGDGGKVNFKKILKGIVTNPLIIGVALGGVLFLAKYLLMKFDVISFSAENGILYIFGAETPVYKIILEPLYKVMTYLSNMATPLALVVLGAQFEFSAVPGMKREIIFATLARIVVVPVIAISVALATGWFSGAHIAAFVALFGTPVAVSTVPMTQELGGDTALAGQLVVWTTLFSGITIFLFSLVLKAIGVF